MSYSDPALPSDAHASAPSAACPGASPDTSPPRRHRRLLSLFASALLLTGCTWVELTDAGLDVNVASTAPDNCALIGRISTNTREKVAGIARNEDRVADELEWLARNEAAGLGANTLVPTSEISGGRRSFDALNCPR